LAVAADATLIGNMRHSTK